MLIGSETRHNTESIEAVYIMQFMFILYLFIFGTFGQKILAMLEISSRKGKKKKKEIVLLLHPSTWQKL